MRASFHRRLSSWKRPIIPKDEFAFLNTLGPARLDFLKAIGEKLSGYGVEFGAGANPFPVGPACRVRYADRNTSVQLRERKYFGDAPIVESDMLSDFESMEGLKWNSPRIGAGCRLAT